MVKIWKSSHSQDTLLILSVVEIAVKHQTLLNGKRLLSQEKYEKNQNVQLLYSAPQLNWTLHCYAKNLLFWPSFLIKSLYSRYL